MPGPVLRDGLRSADVSRVAARHRGVPGHAGAAAVPPRLSLASGAQYAGQRERRAALANLRRSGAAPDRNRPAAVCERADRVGLEGNGLRVRRHHHRSVPFGLPGGRFAPPRLPSSCTRCSTCAARSRASFTSAMAKPTRSTCSMCSRPSRGPSICSTAATWTSPGFMPCTRRAASFSSAPSAGCTSSGVTRTPWTGSTQGPVRSDRHAGSLLLQAWPCSSTNCSRRVLPYA